MTRLAALLLATMLTLVGCAGVGPVSAVPRERLSALVVTALAHLDTPYVRGGNDPAQGFDCSGFTRHLYRAELGVTLPRRSHEQAAARGFVEVPRSALEPGDLVFFNTEQRAFSHVGVYVGDGRFVHAPRPGARVRIEPMGSRYWDARFDGARRIATLAVE